MADQLPINFAIPSESTIASYAYTDVMSGTGVVTFYGFDTEDNSTKSYGLLTSPIYSNNVVTYINSTTASSKFLDLDFDATFANPVVLQGTFRAQVSWLHGNETLANKSGGPTWIVVRLRKYDTSEHEIAANTKSVEMDGVDLEVHGTTANIEFEVPTTKYSPGDILRITVELWAGASVNGASGTDVWLCHDPADRTVDATLLGQGAALTETVPTSQLIFHVPFRLNL